MAEPGTPSKGDPITVVLPDRATAAEQRAAAVVKEEMKANGFNVDEKNPKFHVIVGVNRQVTNYGHESISWVPGIVETTPHNVNESTLYLFVYRADDPRKLAVWDCSAKTRADMYQAYIHSLTQISLEFYGKTKEPEWEWLDTGYKVQDD